jgi:hypothetical protein
MNTDQELLILAAKAADLNLTYCPAWKCMAREMQDSEGWYFDSNSCWNPLTNDGDAFRLAVKLRLVCCAGEHPIFTNNPDRMAAWADRDVMYGSDLYTTEEWSKSTGNPYAATRRAIVRAAAEIGMKMQ